MAASTPRCINCSLQKWSASDRSAMKRWLTEAWYRGSRLLVLLVPLGWLFGLVATRRRQQLLACGPYQASVPVIIVGNITVGGTGKTPLCIALARHFSDGGLNVVIVCRGYGGKGAVYPLVVTAASDPQQAGDEAVLLAQRAGCAVVVDPNRVRAVKLAEQELQAQLVLSDDGLQHYALGRTLELAVVDGERGLGNQQLLPAGPLRELPSRLRRVDIVIANGVLAQPLPVQVMHQFTLELRPTLLVNLVSGEHLTVDQWRQRHRAGTLVHAVAGIGNPGRFFASLQQLGFVIMPQSFADHHTYNANDLAFGDVAPVIMTAKDAVKCSRFARSHWWALEVEAVLPTEFYALLQQLLQKGLAHKP